MRTKKLVFTWILWPLLLVSGGAGHGRPSVEDSPRVIKAVAPKDYPPLASAANVGGPVKIDVKLDRAGDVISANIVEGHKLLQDISKAAALHWKFARDDEGRKERTVQLTFTFIHWTESKEERGTTTFIPPYRVEMVSRLVYIQKESIR